MIVVQSMTVGASLLCALLASTLVSGCALSHQIGESDSGDRSGDDGTPTRRDGGSRFDSGFAAADGGDGRPSSRDGGGTDPGERDLGPETRVDMGPADAPADPEEFETEVDRYVMNERAARASWCPCFAEMAGLTVEECLDFMFRPRECLEEAVAGAPKNEDLAALRCFNNAAERVYFPCVDALTDCSGRMACEEGFIPSVEACGATDAIQDCFMFSR